MSRFKLNKRILSNQMYSSYLEERGLTKLEFNSFNKLKKLTQEEMNLLNNVSHIWKSGDRYYKLAALHYGNPSYWWIIAYYNKKPTEASITVGDTIIIPKPLNVLITLLSE